MSGGWLLSLPDGGEEEEEKEEEEEEEEEEKEWVTRHEINDILIDFYI